MHSCLAWSHDASQSKQKQEKSHKYKNKLEHESLLPASHQDFETSLLPERFQRADAEEDDFVKEKKKGTGPDRLCPTQHLGLRLCTSPRDGFCRSKFGERWFILRGCELFTDTKGFSSFTHPRSDLEREHDVMIFGNERLSCVNAMASPGGSFDL